MSRPSEWETKVDEIIKAIRNHPQLGRGSCHPWDECYTDQELAELLNGKTLEQTIAQGLEILAIWDDRFADAQNSAF